MEGNAEGGPGVRAVGEERALVRTGDVLQDAAGRQALLGADARELAGPQQAQLACHQTPLRLRVGIVAPRRPQRLHLQVLALLVRLLRLQRLARGCLRLARGRQLPQQRLERDAPVDADRARDQAVEGEGERRASLLALCSDTDRAAMHQEGIHKVRDRQGRRACMVYPEHVARARGASRVHQSILVSLERTVARANHLFQVSSRKAGDEALVEIRFVDGEQCIVPNDLIKRDTKIVKWIILNIVNPSANCGGRMCHR